MKTNDFPRLLSDFLLKELPGVRNQSTNTIVSYRDTYIRLLTYCRDILDIKPEALSVGDLTAERITEFLNWLESECPANPAMVSPTEAHVTKGLLRSIHCSDISRCRLRNTCFNANRY